MNVFDKIVAVIADQTGSDASVITEATTFDELGVDSLDIVEMVMRFEEELGLEIEMEEKFDTVGALVKFIESKIKG